MIDLRKKKMDTRNNSTSEQSPKLLQTLIKVLAAESGSVTFIFKTERVQNIHVRNLKDMKTIVRESKQHLNINKESLYREDNRKKSPEELLNMLEDIQWDLGANYFILD